MIILGTFGVPRLEAAQIVFEVLTTAKTKYLKEIHLIHIKGLLLLSAIGEVFCRKCTEEPQNCAVLDENKLIRLLRKRSRDTDAGERFTPNTIKVILARKNEPFEDADAIICPNDEKLSCSLGSAKAIAQSDGSGYQRRCDEAARQRSLHASDVVAVESEVFGTVINAVVPQLGTAAEQLQNAEQLSYKTLLRKTLKNAADEAMKSDCATLAIIPLGAGKRWMNDSEDKIIITANK